LYMRASQKDKKEKESSTSGFQEKKIHQKNYPISWEYRKKMLWEVMMRGSKGKKIDELRYLLEIIMG